MCISAILLEYAIRVFWQYIERVGVAPAAAAAAAAAERAAVATYRRAVQLIPI